MGVPKLECIRSVYFHSLKDWQNPISEFSLAILDAGITAGGATWQWQLTVLVWCSRCLAFGFGVWQLACPGIYSGKGATCTALHALCRSCGVELEAMQGNVQHRFSFLAIFASDPSAKCRSMSSRGLLGSSWYSNTEPGLIADRTAHVHSIPRPNSNPGSSPRVPFPLFVVSLSESVSVSVSLAVSLSGSVSVSVSASVPVSVSVSVSVPVSVSASWLSLSS